MDGPAVVPPISGQGCGSEPQSPKHMPHTLHKDKAHAEGEAGIAGDLHPAGPGHGVFVNPLLPSAARDLLGS